MKYYEPEEHEFTYVAVDVTHRCNMECVNCYIPNRDIPDMDIIKLEECISKFKKRTEIRIIGAEPTVRKDLPQIIKMIRSLGHRPMLNTNGLKLANKDYVKKLIDSGLRVLSISMNGADLDSLYLKTDNLMCAKRKVKALKLCAEMNMFVNINCLIMKGVNELAVGRLIQMAKELDTKIVIRFRNVGQLGRYSLEKDENYSYDDLINLVATTAGVDPVKAKENNVIDGYEEDHNILFQVPDSKIWIKVTDWSPEDSDIPDPGSMRRGRVTPDFKIAPFFEHVKENEFGY